MPQEAKIGTESWILGSDSKGKISGSHTNFKGKFWPKLLTWKYLLGFLTLYELYAFLVSHVPDLHSWWGISPFPVRMCIPGEAHPHSRWGYAFLMTHNPILSEASPRMHIFTGNGNVTDGEWECESLRLHILTENARPYWKWGYDTLIMHIHVGFHS